MIEQKTIALNKSMNMKKRIELIRLLSEELHDTASSYEKEASSMYPYPDYGRGGIGKLNCPESIKRRIKVLREELMELSKML